MWLSVLYHLLLLPYVMYCAKVWGNTYATNIECLVLLQKKAVRLHCGAKRLDHTSRLFYNLHILKVPDIVELRIGIIMCKAYYNLLPMYVQQFFQSARICLCNTTKLRITHLLKRLHVLI